MCRLLCAFVLAGASALAHASIELRVQRVSSPELKLEDVRISVSGLGGGRAHLQAERARIVGREVRNVKLDCTDFSVYPEIRCRGGVLRATGFGPWPIEFSVHGRQREIEAVVQVEPGVRVDASGVAGGRKPRLAIRTAGLQVGRLLAAVPALAPYSPAGQADLAIDLTDFGTARALSASARLVLSGARFSSKDGLRAADGIAAVINVDARRDGERWDGLASIDWRGGELLWDGIYLTGGGTTLSSTITLLPRSVELSQVTLDLAGIGRLNGRARLFRQPLAMREAQLQGRSFDLRALNERFMAPLFAARGWPALVMHGRADVNAVFDERGVSGLSLHLADADLGDAAGRFVLSKIDADLPWWRDSETDMRLAVGESRFGKLTAGPFEAHAGVAPERIVLVPVRIPLLDAALRLSALSFERREGRWNGDISADLEPVSMPELTRALGWPLMAGSLGASVPHVRWRDGVLSLDGQMLVQVFGGYVAANGLQVIEPFGATPRVLADLQMRYIDLEALTDTFKFGRITGRLDGDVAGLELARWAPVSFEGRIRSSEGDYPRRISQRAVESITALGGPGAVAAIQRSFLGVFERFGYKRIGVSCRLRNGVCEMDGLAEKGDGYLLIEGGGVPALSVVGYNRRVDWQELLDRLARVTDAKPVVQ